MFDLKSISNNNNVTPLVAGDNMNGLELTNEGCWGAAGRMD